VQVAWLLRVYTIRHPHSYKLFPQFQIPHPGIAYRVHPYSSRLVSCLQHTCWHLFSVRPSGSLCWSPYRLLSYIQSEPFSRPIRRLKRSDHAFLVHKLCEYMYILYVYLVPWYVSLDLETLITCFELGCVFPQRRG